MPLYRTLIVSALVVQTLLSQDLGRKADAQIPAPKCGCFRMAPNGNGVEKPRSLALHKVAELSRDLSTRLAQTRSVTEAEFLRPIVWFIECYPPTDIPAYQGHYYRSQRGESDYRLLTPAAINPTLYITTDDFGNACATRVAGEFAVVCDPILMRDLRESVKDRLAATNEEWLRGLATKVPILGDHGVPVFIVREDSLLSDQVEDAVNKVVYWHEVGHMLMHHLDSRADSCSSYELELEADSLAGLVLGYQYGWCVAYDPGQPAKDDAPGQISYQQWTMSNKLGRRAALEVWGVLYQEENGSHPKFALRVTAFSNAFDLGKELAIRRCAKHAKAEANIAKVLAAIEEVEKRPRGSPLLWSLEDLK